MSKKSKRMRAMQQVSRKQPVAAAEKPVVQANTEIRQPVVQNPRSSSVVQESQYKYIMPELIRIVIIAGIFFVIIIGLSFIVK